MSGRTDNPKAADRRKWLGQQGEQYAKRFLESIGYRIIVQNWRCRTGELDLVVEKDTVIAIVEVRTRSFEDHYGKAEESIDTRKQAKIRQTAQYYLYREPSIMKSNYNIRFDVIAVLLNPEGKLQRIKHYQCAFE